MMTKLTSKHVCLGRGDQEVRETDPGGRELGADHDEDRVQAGLQPLPRLRPRAQEGLHQGHSQVGKSHENIPYTPSNKDYILVISSSNYYSMEKSTLLSHIKDYF